MIIIYERDVTVMEKHKLVDLLDTSMGKIREMVDVNTIVGAPITTPDGTTIIPVSKLSFGYGTGGGDYGASSFGGGAGAGININPIAFLVVTPQGVRLLNVNQAKSSDGLGKFIDALPDLMDKVESFVEKHKKDKDYE